MAEGLSRNAVVTGAAGGMGRAITKALVESGRRVVLADRDPASLRAFAAEMGHQTFPIELDISDAKAVDRLPDLIPDAFRPIDILINNAGHDIGGRTRFDAGDPGKNRRDRSPRRPQRRRDHQRLSGEPPADQAVRRAGSRRRDGGLPVQPGRPGHHWRDAADRRGLVRRMNIVSRPTQEICNG